MSASTWGDNLQFESRLGMKCIDILNSWINESKAQNKDVMKSR